MGTLLVRHQPLAQPLLQRKGGEAVERVGRIVPILLDAAEHVGNVGEVTTDRIGAAHRRNRLD